MGLKPRSESKAGAFFPALHGLGGQLKAGRGLKDYLLAPPNPEFTSDHDIFLLSACPWGPPWNRQEIKSMKEMLGKCPLGRQKLLLRGSERPHLTQHLSSRRTFCSSGWLIQDQKEMARMGEDIWDRIIALHVRKKKSHSKQEWTCIHMAKLFWKYTWAHWC